MPPLEPGHEGATDRDDRRRADAHHDTYADIAAQLLAHPRAPYLPPQLRAQLQEIAGSSTSWWALTDAPWR